MPTVSAANRHPVKSDLSPWIPDELDLCALYAEDMDETESPPGIYVGGGYLEQLMAEAGIDRPQLAKLSGVSYSHLSNLVNGEKPLTAKVALKLAAPLGMDVAELLSKRPLVPHTTGTIDAFGVLSMKNSTIHFIEAEAAIAGLCQANSLLRFVQTTTWAPGSWQLVQVANLRRLVLVDETGFTTAYGEWVQRSEHHQPLAELVEVRFYPRRIKPA